MILESQYTGPKGSRIITTTVKAGEVMNTKSVAKSFYVISTTGSLTITPEGRTPLSFGAKSGLVFDGELPENLQVNNNTGADITFTLFYGFGSYIDENPAVLGSVTVTSSTLPTGAATAAKQDTGNVSLASVDGKIVLPPALSADGRLKTENQVVGAQANAWNAIAVLAAGVSTAVDTKTCPNVSAFGNVNAATTITIQASQDNVNFYDTASNVVLIGAGDFLISLSSSAKYARLKSSGAATITATIAAK